MSITSDELQQFYVFAQHRLHEASGETLDDIYAEWRSSNPLADVLDQDVKAVKASLRDLDEGEVGRPVGEFSAEFRRRNGI
jgi:hypothetical protein